jgi:hypothetical protein
MKTIKLSDFGENLGTRFVGELVRKAIDEALLGSEPVEVDFSGVSRVTHSFADEVFGSLTRDLGPDIFRTRLKVVGISTDIQALLRFVVLERTRRPTH